MSTNLHHFVRPGIVHFMAFPVMNGEGPILETLTAILTDCFFEVVEISWIKDPKTRAQVKHLLSLSGIQVKYAAHPRLLSQRLSLNSLDQTNRERAVREMFAGIDEALELGASDFCLMSGPYDGPENKAASLDALERSLGEICHYACERGVDVALEVVDRDIDKKCLIGPAADAKEIVERVKAKHRNFGLIVDLSHTPLLGETPAEALRPVADHLARVHIGNCYFDRVDDPAYGDRHPRFGYPGGANDVPEIVAFLEELFHIGYLKTDSSERRAISVEMKPVGDEPVGVMIAGAKRKLLGAWSQLIRQPGFPQVGSR